MYGIMVGIMYGIMVGVCDGVSGGANEGANEGDEICKGRLLGVWYTRGGVILRRVGTIYFTVFETMCCNSAEDMDVFRQLFKLLNVSVNRLVPHKKKLTSIYKRICPSTPPMLPPVTT